MSSLVSVSLDDLIRLASKAQKLKLKMVSAHNSGGYISKYKGRGMEFDEARLYQAGDDIRQIDWKVTARTSKTHTKLFREERERPVFIALDKRRTMNFATRGVFKSVQGANIAGLLAWSAQMACDKVGGQVFNNFKCIELKPQSGRLAVLRLFNAIINIEKHTQEINLNHVLKRLVKHVHPGSQVFLISDFRGLDERSEFHLNRLAKHSDLTLIYVFDILETKLPSSGHYRFVDNTKSAVVDCNNSKVLENYQAKFATRLKQLTQIAIHLNINLLQCSTSDNPVDILR